MVGSVKKTAWPMHTPYIYILTSQRVHLNSGLNITPLLNNNNNNNNIKKLLNPWVQPNPHELSWTLWWVRLDWIFFNTSCLVRLKNPMTHAHLFYNFSKLYCLEQKDEIHTQQAYLFEMCLVENIIFYIKKISKLT